VTLNTKAAIFSIRIICSGFHMLSWCDVNIQGERERLRDGGGGGFLKIY